MPKTACEGKVEEQVQGHEDANQVLALSAKRDSEFVLYRSQMINTWFEFFCLFLPYCEYVLLQTAHCAILTSLL